MTGQTQQAQSNPPTQGPPTPAGPADGVCPYCGASEQRTGQCERCGGLFDPLSRQASQNQMGPWFIRDEARPFRPGCSYETLQKLVRRGAIDGDTILRGPTTMQFWTRAGNAPGVAHLLGECHNCHQSVRDDEYMCAGCGVVFAAPADRQALGLGPVRLLPGSAPAHIVAQSSIGAGESRFQMAAREDRARLSMQEHPPAQEELPVEEGEAAVLVDARNAQQSSIRRLRKRVASLKMVIALLVLVNVLLLLVLAVVMNPRLNVADPTSASPTVSEPAQQPATPATDASLPPSSRR